MKEVKNGSGALFSLDLRVRVGGLGRLGTATSWRAPSTAGAQSNLLHPGAGRARRPRAGAVEGACPAGARGRRRGDSVLI